jgi:hypothetical protein
MVKQFMIYFTCHNRELTNNRLSNDAEGVNAQQFFTRWDGMTSVAACIF